MFDIDARVEDPPPAPADGERVARLRELVDRLAAEVDDLSGRAPG